MFLKNFKPKNSSLRFRININKKLLNLVKFKKLFYKIKNNSGRNITGRITIRHKGSGIFNFRRNVDIFRNYSNSENSFISYDIDKKFSTFLALFKFSNGNRSYILAPDNLNKKQNITTTFYHSSTFDGYCLPLGWIKNNTIIYNIEGNPERGGKYAKSAGTYGLVIHHSIDSVLVKLPSKQLKYFSKFSLASLGRCSNILHFFKNKGKAGVSRYYNIRPTVRGETMNPIDHPMGGRTRGGKPTKNPWGKIIK